MPGRDGEERPVLAPHTPAGRPTFHKNKNDKKKTTKKNAWRFLREEEVNEQKMRRGGEGEKKTKKASS